MTDLRKDPVTGRWVIIATERQKRPSDFRVESVVVKPDGSCPFCEGHEERTPPEILAYRNGTPGNTRGWEVRVVPNKFPALRVEGSLDREGEGLFDRMSGIGAHEVIIESPNHDADAGHVERGGDREGVLGLARTRARSQARHPPPLHRDLQEPWCGGRRVARACTLAAHRVADRAARDDRRAGRRQAPFQQKERCVFCDIMRQELKDGARVIAESADFVALAPYAPRFPFEAWLLPKRHRSRFEEATPGEFASLARMLKDTLRRMNATLTSPPYNLIVHSAPLQDDAGPFYHWHIEVMPKLTRVAGFEWGTGFYINPTGPEEAAEVLRKTKV